jgi:SAM-dependent methyltransferase
MTRFLESHVTGDAGTVLEVGSRGTESYRPLLEDRGWRYTGLDVGEGPNVDLVAEDPFHWEIEDSRFDLVVSGQVFEHIDFFWITFLEMARVLKPGGLVILIAPSRGDQHRHPVDCWRFYPDGFSALAKWAGLELIETNNPWKVDRSVDLPSMCRWGDTAGVFRKPDSGLDRDIGRLTESMRRYLAAVTGARGEGRFPEVPYPVHRETYFCTETAARDVPVSSFLRSLPARVWRRARRLRRARPC